MHAWIVDPNLDKQTLEKGNVMTKLSHTVDLLNAAKLSAAKEQDQLLVYLIDMAILRASDSKAEVMKKSA